MDPQTQVTRLLQEWKSGEDGAFDKLVPIVYDELRQLARDTDEKAGTASPPSTASPPQKKDSKKKSKTGSKKKKDLSNLTTFQRELAVEGVDWYVS